LSVWQFRESRIVTLAGGGKKLGREKNMSNRTYCDLKGRVGNTGHHAGRFSRPAHKLHRWRRGQVPARGNARERRREQTPIRENGVRGNVKLENTSSNTEEKNNSISIP